MKKIGFIGAGNMGYPLLCGAIKQFGKEQVTFRCAHEEKNKMIETETGVSSAPSLRELVQQVSVIVLAVKPQFFDDILTEIKEDIRADHTIVSMAPGVTIEYLSNALGKIPTIVRTMPNTPAMVGEGMTAICFGNQEIKEENETLITKLFEAVGKTVILKESLMDASIIASGSSPAFLYLFMEALADGAVKYGIPRAQAYEMVAQTMIGAGKMLLETKEHPGKLKDNVCSPGGTTIAGVAALEEHGFRNAVIKACDACFERAQELKK